MRQTTGRFEQIKELNWGKNASGLDHVRFFRSIDPDAVVAPSFTKWDGPPIAIADDSGRFPCDTEDGVLWLDLSSLIQIGSNASIPILCMTDSGKWERNTAPMNPGHALVVAGHFRLPVQTRRENGQHVIVGANTECAIRRELR